MNAQRLLTDYLTAPSGSAHRFMEPLAEEIRRTVHRCLSKREVGDLEDFEEDCVIAIWTRIESMRQDASLDGIDNLEAFVRRTVHNRYCDAIRRKRPSWYNLKLELLEMFSGKLNVEGFAIWQSPSGAERLCGFETWRGRRDAATAACRGISEAPEKFLKRALGNRDPGELSTAELAAAVLDWIGGPVDIDDLTSCLASLRGLRDFEPLSIDAQPEGEEDMDSPLEWLISSDVNVEEQVIGQGWMKHVLDWFWREFGQLSLKQRKAIFLGLASEQAVTIISTRGLTETAEALELEPRALAELIGRLPLPDVEIAEQLEIPVRSVPSVRFKAWRRIQRRARRSELTDAM